MSKFMFFDFRCTSCDKVIEEFVKPDVQETECPDCNGKTKRLASCATFVGNGLDPSMPTAYDKWAKANAKKTAEDKKFYADHGADKKHHSCGS